MSFSTVKRALGWADKELKSLTAFQTPRNPIVPISMSPGFKISAKHQDHSPPAGIDLKSNASSSDAASIYTIDSRKRHVPNLEDSESLYTPSLHWVALEGTNEKRIDTPSFNQESSGRSGGPEI